MRTDLDASKQAPLKVFGAPGCAPSYSIRDFLHRSDIPFEWTQLKSDKEAQEKLGVPGLHDDRLPVVFFPDGTRFDRPTIRQVTEKLGWFHDPTRSEYDLAIYGAGPAGLSAAVYGASEGLKTVLIERNAIGGQAGTSSRIENYLGFPDGISGAQLAERARNQAIKFGADILIAREGVSAKFETGKGVGTLADGTKIVARATICSTGINYRKLDLPNEDTFFGQGLYYGAGSSEAVLCSGEHVIVVGGGNSAGQAALNFLKYAKQVTIVVRGDALKDTLSQYLVDRVTVVAEHHGVDQHQRHRAFRRQDAGVHRSSQRTDHADAADSDEMAFRLHRWHAVYGLGGGCGNRARFGWIFGDRAGFAGGHSGDGALAARSRAVLLGNEYAGGICGGRCAAWLGETLRFGGGGRRDGGGVRAPIFGERLEALNGTRAARLLCGDHVGD